MNSEWFGMLQQAYETARKHFHNQPGLPTPEETVLLSDHQRINAKKKHLRQVYLLREIFDKPVSIRDDEKNDPEILK
jgi:hypothetical protein